MSSSPHPLRRIALPAYGPTLLFGIGEGAVMPVLPLTARELGASVSAAAMMVALMGLGSLISNIPASHLTARHGERWAIVGAAVWSALALVICAMTPHLAILAVGCFMVGMSQGVFNLARQSYLTEAVPVAYRARALSTLGGVMRIGFFIGPFVSAAAIYQWGVGAAYVVGFIALCFAGMVAFRIPDLPSPVVPAGSAPHATPSTFNTLRDHHRIFLTVGLGVLFVAAVRSSRQAVIPLWADHLALTPSVASLIYGLAGGIEMLMFYPAGRMMDLKGRRWVALPSMLIMGIALLLMPLSQSMWALLIAAMAIGFGNGISSGLIMTLGADYSPPAGRAHFLGVWRFMADLGALGGPIVLSFLTAAFSLGVGVLATGGMALAAAAALGYWLPPLSRPKR